MACAFCARSRSRESFPQYRVCQILPGPGSHRSRANDLRNSSSINSSDSIHFTSTRRLFATPPCVSASRSDLYESSSSTYLPTIAIEASPPDGSRIVATRLRHSARSACGACAFETQLRHDQIVETLLVKRERNFVNRVDVLRADHRTLFHVTEQRDLCAQLARQRLFRSTQKNVGLRYQSRAGRAQSVASVSFSVHRRQRCRARALRE